MNEFALELLSFLNLHKESQRIYLISRDWDVSLRWNFSLRILVQLIGIINDKIEFINRCNEIEIDLLLLSKCKFEDQILLSIVEEIGKGSAVLQLYEFGSFINDSKCKFAIIKTDYSEK